MNTRFAAFPALVIWYLVTPIGSHPPPQSGPSFWYLLTPPNIESHPPLQPGPNFFSTSPVAPRSMPQPPPLSTWRSLGQFNSEEQCNTVHTSAIHNTVPTVERYEAQLDDARRRLDDAATPELQSELHLLRAYYASLISAKCVAADDPRLVEK